jgi:hypothetical protein
LIFQPFDLDFKSQNHTHVDVRRSSKVFFCRALWAFQADQAKGLMRNRTEKNERGELKRAS